MTLSGRELDEACAIAMGHKIETPRYSSAASTLDEKLAWLRQYGAVEITQWFSVGDVEARTFGTTQRRFDRTAKGKDIHEATARLVVAVAEEAKKR